MYKALIVSSALALASLSTNAFADGAVASAGAVAEPPRDVVAYVREQPNPVSTAVVEEPVVVGHPLSAQVVVTPIPNNPNYGYAVVNNQRVIVEPKSHNVVQIVE